MMSQKHNGNNGNYGPSKENDADDLERLLSSGITFDETEATQTPETPITSSREEDDDEASNVPLNGDVQGALAVFAEAAQDMATASLELSLGRHFACADYCNQVAEKAAQAVNILHIGRRSRYDHDLRALGVAVGAPPDIQEEMAILTPFHPEAFYMNTPPEEADEVISAEQANSYVQSARKVLRWARNIVLNP